MTSEIREFFAAEIEAEENEAESSLDWDGLLDDLLGVTNATDRDSGDDDDCGSLV